MESITIKCWYCGREMSVDAMATSYRCESCGRRVDVLAQAAYQRGLNFYQAGQELRAKLRPTRTKRVYEMLTAENIQLYQQAYSALEYAFQSDLAEEQRHEGIAMMADMSRLFAERGMNSFAVASYWARLMNQVEIRLIQAALDARLADPANQGWLNGLRRWFWRTRSRQLAAALARLEAQINQLEALIGFIEPPRVRRT